MRRSELDGVSCSAPASASAVKCAAATGDSGATSCSSAMVMLGGGKVKVSRFRALSVDHVLVMSGQETSAVRKGYGAIRAKDRGAATLCSYNYVVHIFLLVTS